jgi:mannose-6-phosphate isomerase-like protein (cupin superfamily)
MQAFELDKVAAQCAREKRAWLEFLRVGTLSAGVYRLKAGEEDKQQPHTEDEVYYVVSGKASFRAGPEQMPIGPGSVLYVERAVAHRFFDVREDLTVLVFFAPPEGSLKQ